MCGRYRRRHPPPTHPFYSACVFFVVGSVSCLPGGGRWPSPRGRPHRAPHQASYKWRFHTELRWFYNGVDSLRSTIFSPARTLRGLGSQSITASPLRNAAGRGNDGHRRWPVVLCPGVRSGWHLAPPAEAAAGPVPGSVAARHSLPFSLLAGLVAGAPLVVAQARLCPLQRVVCTYNTISVKLGPPS